MDVVCFICSAKIKYDDVRCIVCSAATHETCMINSGGKRDDNGNWTCNRCLNPDAAVAGSSAALLPCLINNPQQSSLTSHHFEAIMSQLSAISVAVQQCNTSIEANNKMLLCHGEQLDRCNKEIVTLKAENAELRAHISALEEKVREVDPPVLFSEVRDRLNRENNLIITGLAERGTSESDEVEVKNVLSSLFENSSDPPPSYVSVTRIGKRRTGNPRPVKVSFSCSASTLQVLKSKNKMDKSKYPAVVIRADLTVNQRRYMSELRAELDSRKSRGEDDLTIRYVRGNPTIVRVSSSGSSKRGREEDESPGRVRKYSGRSRSSTLPDDRVDLARPESLEGSQAGAGISNEPFLQRN